jgi:AcrR family transcriptional regulator
MRVEAIAEASKPPPRGNEVRRRLALAAIDLFLAQGFDETRVEEVAEAAGVSRRTAFRYSRTKEDLVFPDHEPRRAMLSELLEGSDPALPALEAVRMGAERALETFVADAPLVIRRYQLVEVVPAIREREVGEISLYEAMLSRFLRRRWLDDPNGELRARVAAAAVVAAHNHVLRRWLREGGTYDPTDEARDAFRFVASALSPDARMDVTRADSPDVVVASRGDAEPSEPEVVLAVVRGGEPVADAMREFVRLLEGRSPPPTAH